MKPDMLRMYVEPGVTTKPSLVEIVYNNDEIRVERRLFDISTYTNLKTNKNNCWEYIDAANDFVRTEFDNDEYSYLVKLYIRAKRDLMQIYDRNSLMNAVEAIDEKVNKTFTKLALPDRLFNYVVKNEKITMPDLSLVGTRVQDTPEKTFYEDDYHLINTMVIASKLLFPIFGEIIDKVKYTKDTYSGVKEIVAFGIIKTFLLNYFDPITKKIKNFITTIVEQKKMVDDPMLAFYGITEMSLANDKLAKLFVKVFVNHNLYQKDGNIMKLLTVTAKRGVETDTGGSKKKFAYKARILPELGGDDGRNISFLENSVSIVNEPVDIPIIVRLSIDQFVNNYIAQNNILPSLFEQACSFYKVSLVPPTPLNELIVAMFIADPVGAAYSLKYFDMEMMIKIIVLVQIYAMRMGFKEIVPLLTMVPMTNIKVVPDQIDNYILTKDGLGTGGVNYLLNLKEATSHLKGFGNFDFDGLMKNLLSFVVSVHHNFNVAPMILSLGDTGTTTIDEEGIVKYDENIISELRRFMYYILRAPEDRAIQ